MILSVTLLVDFYTLRKEVESTSTRVEEIVLSAGLQHLEKELAALESKAADSTLWDDRAKAQETLSALTDVKDKLKLLKDFQTQVLNFSSYIVTAKYTSSFLGFSALRDTKGGRPHSPKS